MESINTKTFSNFAKPQNNSVKKSDTKINMYVNTGIAAGSTLTGAAAGYGLYRKDRNELDQALKKAESEQVSAKAVKLLDVLKSKFADLVVGEKQGKPRVFPNCIMLVGEDPELNNALIKWTGENANTRFIQISPKDKVIANLKASEKLFDEKAERSLIHIDGFDQLLDHSLTPEHKIESLKDIMSAAAEDYHSTIIFSTTDPSKLDKIALEPHRVERIDVYIKKAEFEAIETANKTVSRLKESLGKLSKTKKMLPGSIIGLTVGGIILGIRKFLSARSSDK